jgi:hypothetical protein
MIYLKNKNMDKKEVYVRFANESVYYNKIKVDPLKVKDPHQINEEVFCTIDDFRVAIKKNDYNMLMKPNVEFK